jgi:hypothetical protein
MGVAITVMGREPITKAFLRLLCDSPVLLPFLSSTIFGGQVNAVRRGLIRHAAILA